MLSENYMDLKAEMLHYRTCKCEKIKKGQKSRVPQVTSLSKKKTGPLTLPTSNAHSWATIIFFHQVKLDFLNEMYMRFECEGAT
jgi:hypothetical protein